MKWVAYLATRNCHDVWNSLQPRWKFPRINRLCWLCRHRHFHIFNPRKCCYYLISPLFKLSCNVLCMLLPYQLWHSSNGYSLGLQINFFEGTVKFIINEQKYISTNEIAAAHLQTKIMERTMVQDKNTVPLLRNVW